MRQRLARALRKWADLVDPRTPPSSRQNLTVVIDCDSRPFVAEIQRLTGLIEGFERGVATFRIEQEKRGGL